MLHTTYEINQYVIFKYQDEWQEGRITDIVVSDSSEKDIRTYYKVLSFMTLLEVPTLLFDHILINNSENIKKVKNVIEKIPISKELRTMIEYDKQMNNKIYKGTISLSVIFSDFTKFLSTTKCNMSKEEIFIGTEGLQHIFDSLLERVLISQKEIKYYENILKKILKNKEENPLCSNFGIVYGIRIVYYTLTSLLENLSDQEIKFILYEFLIYFLDFCSLKIEIYFFKEQYE